MPPVAAQASRVRWNRPVLPIALTRGCVAAPLSHRTHQVVVSRKSDVSWWGWLLLAWVVIATVAAFWIGAVAAVLRRRERAARAHRYRAFVEEDRTQR